MIPATGYARVVSGQVGGKGEILAPADCLVGVAKFDGDSYFVNGHVRRAEQQAVVPGVAAEPAGDLPRIPGVLPRGRGHSPARRHHCGAQVNGAKNAQCGRVAHAAVAQVTAGAVQQ
jgi:hypothetical protein